MLLSRRHFLGPPLRPPPCRDGEMPGARTRAHFCVRSASRCPTSSAGREVDYETSEAPGTIVVDTQKRFSITCSAAASAMRYGVGVGDDGKTWSGEAVMRRKAGMADLAAHPGTSRRLSASSRSSGTSRCRAAAETRWAPARSISSRATSIRSTASTAPTSRTASAAR